MPAAYFVVRAKVADPAKRKAFDKWYQTEHMPDAAKSFGVTKAWRFWSLADPSIHQATYQFDDEASLDRAMKSEDMKRLVADFNRDWPDVTRTRETFVLAQEFAAQWLLRHNPHGEEPPTGPREAGPDDRLRGVSNHALS